MKLHTRLPLFSLSFLLGLAAVSAVRGQTDVGTATALQNAINAGDMDIVLTANIAVTAPIYIGTSSTPTLTIDGGGNSITGTSELFFIQSGTVSLSHATLTGAAVGGNGGTGQDGGGGAAGMGGAIFVGATANVSVSGVQFTNNAATGGSGGASIHSQSGFGGGGGVNGGNGGAATTAGGGGGGNGGNAGSDINSDNGSGGGGLASAGGSPPNNTTGGTGGGPHGGAGGVGGGFNAAPGGNATGPNSGGGGGTFGMGGNGGGGAGSINGGGGGAGAQFGSSGGSGGEYGGGGGSLGPGGNAGFGGGGGAGYSAGGTGGFGGGGGAGTVTGVGGVGGGSGQNSSLGAGGGGAGLGGAVFVQAGGTLTVTGTQSFTGSSVTAGTGFTNGAAAGSDLFLMSGTTTTLAPGTGNTVTLNGTIADDSLASLPSGQSYTAGNGEGAAITIGSGGSTGGTVVLNGANTYSGGTTVSSGTLNADNNSALGTGAVTVSSGGSLQVSGASKLYNNITVSGTGDGGAGAIFANDGLQNEVFGTVTLAGDASINVQLNGILLHSTIDLGSHTLTTGGPTAGEVEILGHVIGTGGLTVAANSRTLITSQTSDTYTGVTTVSTGATLNLGDFNGAVAIPGDLNISGTVETLSSSQLASNTVVTLSGGGQFLFSTSGAASESFAGLNGTSGTKIAHTTGGMSSGNDALTVSGSGNYSYAGQINNTSFSHFVSTISLTKSGTGTQTLSGASNYSGGTTLNAGTLVAENSTALGTGTVTVGSGASLQLSGGVTMANNLTISGTGNGGAGAIFAADDNFETIAGSITLAGDASINDSNPNFDLLHLTGTVGLGAHTLTLGGNHETEISNQINGTGGITLGSAITVLLNGATANTYTGLTTVPSGADLQLYHSQGATAVPGDLNIAGEVDDEATGQLATTSVVTLSGSGTFVFVNAHTSESIAGLDGSSASAQIGSMAGMGTNTLTLGGAGVYSYAGQINDMGNSFGPSVALVKQGTGTQTLSGTNTYSGGTTLAGGVLQAGSTTALGTGTISFTGGTLQYGAGGLDFSSQFSTAAAQLYSIDTDGNDIQFGTALTSSGGSLTKLGIGTLFLSTANTYSGGTTISEGGLKLGDGVTPGASLGSGDVTVGSNGLFTLDLAVGETFSNAIVNNGQVALDDSPTSNYTVASTITGMGTLLKTGTNAVTITGHNNYSGGTTLSAGTLIAGNSAAFGTGLVQVNAGTLMLGNNNHTITVGSYAQTGGTLVLGVNGTGLAATADLLHVTNTMAGQVSLGGELLVDVSGFTPAAPVHGGTTTYTFHLVDTNGGYTGQFSIPVISGFVIGDGLTASLDYSTLPDDVLLQIIQAAAPVNAFSVIGLSGNQQAVLGPINAGMMAGSTNPNFVALTNALTPLSTNSASLGAALDQLSPLNFGQFSGTTAIDDASFATQSRDGYLATQRTGPNGTFAGGNGGIDASGLTINDRSYDPTLAMVHSRLLAWNAAPLGVISDSPGAVLGGVEMRDPKEMKSMAAPAYSDPWNFYIQGNVILAQGFSQPGVAHFDDNTESVQVGADYRVTPNLLVGLAAGYGHTDATLDTNGSSATVDSYSPGFYASYADHGWYANLSGDYIHNAYTQSRVIAFLGQTATSAPEGNEGVANLDGGYDFHHGAWTFGPLAGLQYTHLTVDGYTESGSVADLSVNEQDVDSLRSRLGGRLSYALCRQGVSFTPHLDASWQHEFMEQSRGITSQFTGGVGSFSVVTPNPSRDSALVDAGLDAEISGTVTVFADYIVEAGQQNYFGQSVQAGAKIGF